MDYCSVTSVVICTLSSTHSQQASKLTALAEHKSSFLMENSTIQKLSITVMYYYFRFCNKILLRMLKLVSVTSTQF